MANKFDTIQIKALYFPNKIQKFIGFIVPSGLTFGDLIVANFLKILKRLGDAELMEKLCPNELNQYINRVFGNVSATKRDSPEEELAKVLELVKYIIAARK